MSSSNSCGNGPAHPRAGGENRYKEWFALVPGGSSPRGRGKLSLVCLSGVRLRLIPARAGKTI